MSVMVLLRVFANPDMLTTINLDPRNLPPLQKRVKFADTVTTALNSLFPEDPPRSLARTPHGYYKRPTIERNRGAGRFAAREATDITAEAIAKGSGGVL